MPYGAYSRQGGLLSIPAGLALIGLGVATLWRTRSSSDGRARRYFRRSLFGSAGAVVALLVIAPLRGSYLHSHLGRAVVPAANLGADPREYERRVVGFFDDALLR
jgi:hypothetical protein